MWSTGIPPAQRRAAAAAALAALDGGLAAHRVLEVRWRRSHHVAVVVDLDGRLVYRAMLVTRGHGHNDRVDEGHHGDPRGRLYADLLEVGADELTDDGLPASCECGPRTLSRSQLLTSIAGQKRRLLVG